MKRDPSIHIRLSSLKKVFKKYGLDDVDDIFLELKKYHINRTVIISNKKDDKKVKKALKSSKYDTFLLSDIIYSVRIKLKHRGIKKITESDKLWDSLKELTKLVNQFCDDFDLEKRNGYIKYVELAFSKITSLTGYINKFINLYESITQEFDSLSELNNDDNRDLTIKFHNLFCNKISDKTGITQNYLDKPNKMICFYKARKLCDDLNIDYNIFIDAQFDALDWCNGLPYPETLINEKAKEHLNKYLYENNIQVSNKDTSDFWKKLKDDKD